MSDKFKRYKSTIICLLMVVLLFVFNIVLFCYTKHQKQAEPKTSYMIESISAIKQEELKAGCEIYACTVVLQYHGFDINEQQFSENYLICKPIVYEQQYYRYGPDMHSAYAGDVYEGYGIYAPAMVKSMNAYLKTQDTKLVAYDVTGQTLESLCQEYIVNDIPVMVWATTYMYEPYEKESWTVNYVDENAKSEIGDTVWWMQNEHCLTLMGYDEENYYFCDSVSGDITGYEKEISQQRYVELGAQAIVVK